VLVGHQTELYFAVDGLDDALEIGVDFLDGEAEHVEAALIDAMVADGVGYGVVSGAVDFNNQF
jgi:hypothetical protein